MFLFLDTETHAEQDPIMIQLAYRLDKDGAYFDELYSTGGQPIDLKAMAVHHIEESDISEKPYFNETTDADVLQDLLNEHALVAHNVAFDANVLQNHDMKTPETICTLKLSRFLFPELEQHRLQYLRYYFETKLDPRPTAHDALGDVIVLEAVFWKLYDALKESESLETDEQIKERMIDISSRPSILYMCKFGKHKGTLWSEVPLDYLHWIVNISDFTDEDVLYTAKHYLDEKLHEQNKQ